MLDKVVALVLVSCAAATLFRWRRLPRGGLCWRSVPPEPLPADFPLTARRVSEALCRIESHVHRTPVLTCGALDRLAHRRLFFKCELFQKTGSFKDIGRRHSSGNHAQAIALAAKSSGRAAHIVMPRNAPATKQQAVAAYGGHITLCDPTNEARAATAEEVRLAVEGHFVHPSNDCDVIAGQGTVAAEFLAQVAGLDALLVPVGGGGLIGGISVYAKAATRGRIKVIGAEPRAVDDASRSKAAGQLITDFGGGPVPDTLADGLKTVLGSNTWPCVRDCVDAILTVDEAQIADATKLVWGRMKLCIEPSAGVGVAVALSDEFAKLCPADEYKRVGVVLCGGNLDLAMAAKTLFASS